MNKNCEINENSKIHILTERENLITLFGILRTRMGMSFAVFGVQQLLIFRPRKLKKGLTLNLLNSRAFMNVSGLAIGVF